MDVLVYGICELLATCLKVKANVVQNRKKSMRLLDSLQAIEPPLRTLKVGRCRLFTECQYQTLVIDFEFAFGRRA